MLAFVENYHVICSFKFKAQQILKCLYGLARFQASESRGIISGDVTHINLCP